MKKRKGALVLLLVSVFLIEESIRLQFSGVLFGNSDLDSMEAGLTITPNNADFSFSLAKTYHTLMLEDQQRAVDLFVISIKNNPLSASSWLELSEIFIEQDQESKALWALARAKQIAPLSIARLWQGSILALRLGQIDWAFDNFSVIVRADTSLRARVFETSWLVSNDFEFIFNKIVSNDDVLFDYFNYLMNSNRADASLLVWDKINNNGIISSDKLFIRYIDFLIDSNKSKRAYPIWEKTVGSNESDNLIWNGSFEKELLNGGFGWRFNNYNRQGTIIDIDSEKTLNGQRSVRLNFDGESNVDLYHISQIVPVEPDTEYLFTANLNTDNITTKNGISWEIYCYSGTNAGSSTEPLTGTNDWTKVSVKFKTPDDCSDVMVRIRRFKSRDFDKFISGTVWIDDISLVELENS